MVEDNAMRKEEITELLEEYDFENDQIDLLLKNNFLENRDEQKMREIAQRIIEDKNKAEEIARQLAKAIDKAAQKRVLTKNTAARKKSRMMKKVNAVKK